MTTEQIHAKGAKEYIKHETAVKIRELLDAARVTYGENDWTENDVESEILSLVTDEE